MPTQGERQNYLWRPNDYSSTTLARYDQEAEHWMRAFNNAASKNKPVNFAGSFAAIGLCISLFVSLVTLIILILIDLFRFIHKAILNQKNKGAKQNAKAVSREGSLYEGEDAVNNW